MKLCFLFVWFIILTQVITSRLLFHWSSIVFILSLGHRTFPEGPIHIRRPHVGTPEPKYHHLHHLYHHMAVWINSQILESCSGPILIRLQKTAYCTSSLTTWYTHFTSQSWFVFASFLQLLDYRFLKYLRLSGKLCCFILYLHSSFPNCEWIWP